MRSLFKKSNKDPDLTISTKFVKYLFEATEDKEVIKKWNKVFTTFENNKTSAMDKKLVKQLLNRHFEVEFCTDNLQYYVMLGNLLNRKQANEHRRFCTELLSEDAINLLFSSNISGPAKTALTSIIVDLVENLP